jgi:hypothetical protein
MERVAWLSEPDTALVNLGMPKWLGLAGRGGGEKPRKCEGSL